MYDTHGLLGTSSKMMTAPDGCRTDKKCHRVCEGLYISSASAARDLSSIRAAGITHIVNAAVHVEPCHHSGDGLQYHIVDCFDCDTENIALFFDGVNTFIEDALATGGRVLVHCYAGVSRSAALCMAYLIRNQRHTVDSSLDAVRAARPVVCPNDGFMEQLDTYYESIQQTQAASP